MGDYSNNKIEKLPIQVYADGPSFNEIEYFVKKPILEIYCRNLENSVFERKVTNTKIKKIPVISNTNVLKSKNSIPKKEIINNPTAL